MLDQKQCWKCKDIFEPNKGKISEKGNFTCFSCLRDWYNEMKPVWSIEHRLAKQKQEKTPVSQMSFFEIQELVHDVF